MMSYKIDKITDLKIIKVTVNEELSYHEKKEAYSEAINILNKNDWRRLLFDIRGVIEGKKHTVGDSIDLFQTIKKLLSKKNIKSAFISTDKKGKHTVLGIILKTILDIEVKHFTNYEETIKWLGME